MIVWEYFCETCNKAILKEEVNCHTTAGHCVTALFYDPNQVIKIVKEDE
jgi:hypothetical protein